MIFTWIRFPGSNLVAAAAIAALLAGLAPANAAIVRPANSASRLPGGWLWTDNGIAAPLQKVPGFVLSTPQDVISTFENCGRATVPGFPRLPEPVAFLAVNTRVGLETYGKMFDELAKDLPRQGRLDSLPDTYLLSVDGIMKPVPMTRPAVEFAAAVALADPHVTEIAILHSNWYTPGTAAMLATRVGNFAPTR